MAKTAEVSIPARERGCKLGCVACGTEFERAAQDFRCVNCGELLEVFYPAWEKGDPSHADELRTLWLERRKSLHALDQSGVWRFRELLPGMLDWNKVITLREGNTPIFELPRCAKSAGVRRLRAKHQGMNPTGSFKDTGMRAAISVAVEEKCRWVAWQLRTDFDGCLQLLREVIRRLPVYLLNSVNPYRLEGQKTAAIELLEQLGWA